MFIETITHFYRFVSTKFQIFKFKQIKTDSTAFPNETEQFWNRQLNLSGFKQIRIHLALFTILQLIKYVQLQMRQGFGPMKRSKEPFKMVVWYFNFPSNVIFLIIYVPEIKGAMQFSLSMQMQDFDFVSNGMRCNAICIAIPRNHLIFTLKCFSSQKLLEDI